MLARILSLLLVIVALPAAAQDAPPGNLPFVVVSTGYDASATSIVLTTGHGARLTGTPPYNCAWFNASDYPGGVDASGALDPNYEIVRVTGRSTDTLTVTRAQESTSASTKNTGGKVYVMSCGITAKTFTDINNGVFLSATIDTDSFCVDAPNNRVGIGTCSPAFKLHAVSDGSALLGAFDTYGSNSALRLRRGNGTASAITRVASGDSLGAFQWWGASKDDTAAGATFAASAATLRVTARENFTTTGRGSQFEFQTADNGGTAVATALAVNSDSVDLSTSVDLTMGSGGIFWHADNFNMFATTGHSLYPGGSGTNEGDAYIRYSSVNNAGGGTTSNQLIQLMTARTDATTNYFNPLTRWRATDGTNNSADVGEFGVEGAWTNAGGFTTRRIYLWDFVRKGGAGATIFRWEDNQQGQLNIGGDDENFNLHVDQGHYIARSHSDTAANGTNLDLYRYTNLVASDPERARAGDVLGAVRAFGGEAANDTDFASTPSAASGSLRFEALSSHTTTNHYARAIIATAGSGSTTLTDRVTIDDTGLRVASQRVRTEYQHTFTIETPGGAENFGGVRFNQAATITKVVAVLQGSSTPSVTWQVRHGTDRSATGTDTFTANKTTTSTTTGAVETSTFNDATVAADEFLWLVTTAQSGTVTGLHVTVFYTVD